MEEICAAATENDDVLFDVTGTAPEICTYSFKSTIAEKLDAILDRMETTSRMKDLEHFVSRCGNKICQITEIEATDTG